MSTIQDVAKAAGVSSATISRVLNNSSSVSEQTRAIVLNTIKKLNYQPNFLGRNLRRSETRMILVLLPSISNPFYSGIVKGIEDVGHKNGYNVMLCNTDSEKQRELVYLDLLKSKLADGIIFMATELDSEELSRIGRNYPAVQCCEYNEGAFISHVSIDNFIASYKAVKHLISLGHRKIGMISCSNNFISTIQREAGYKKALGDHGITLNPDFLIYGDYSFKSGLRATTQFLNMQDCPSAIFSISDSMAIGAIKAVREYGFNVPEDIAVVGFDDISLASMYDPPLTTVSQPRYDLGCMAMEILLKQIKGEIKEPINIVIEHELVIRNSTIKQ